jgi:hypothetical protein
VALLLVEALAHAAVHWEHRVGAGGAALTLRTADGRTLRGTDVGAALNRLLGPPLVVLDAAEPGDREYARNEITAFAASWLCTLSATVVNAPHPHGLCGRWRQPLEWRALAARAGLACAPLRLASEGADVPRALSIADPAGTTTVLSVDGRPLHPGVPAAVQRGCVRLSALSATRLLGLRFEGADPARAGWRFVDATPYPDLSLAGEAGVAAIEAALIA